MRENQTGLFQNSETLVGVMRDQTINSSRALTLDVSFSVVFIILLALLSRLSLFFGQNRLQTFCQLRKYQAA